MNHMTYGARRQQLGSAPPLQRRAELLSGGISASVEGNVIYVRDLLGWLETRLAQIDLSYLFSCSRSFYMFQGNLMHVEPA